MPDLVDRDNSVLTEEDINQFVLAYKDRNPVRIHLLNAATRGKYFHMLKQPNDLPPVKLCRDKNGDLFVGGNGNHRVTFYKLMAETDDLMLFAAGSQLYRLRHLREPYQLYWLYAFVKDEL